MKSVTELDALRVKADALLEDGDPQGEAIQLALSLEEMPLADPKRPKAEGRYDELVARHGPRWLQPLRVALGDQAIPDAAAMLFRGLAARLHGDAATILRALPNIERRILALDLSWPRPAELRQLADSDVFTHLASFELVLYHPVDETVRALFASQRFPALHSLGLTDLTRAAARHVTLAAPRLRTLQRLAIGAGQQEPATFADISWLLGESIVHLELDRVAVTADDIDVIAERCPRLRSLGLAHASIDAKVCARLDQPAFAGVERLALGGNPLNPAGVAAIASTKALANVAHVSFARPAAADPPFGAKLLEAFVDALTWKRLLGLDLGSCNIRAEGVPLLGAKKLAKLAHLGLARNALSDAGAKALAKLPLAGLRSLDLAGNTLKQPAMAALAKAKWLAHVESLRLRHNKFGSAGAQSLAKASLAKLRFLSIGHNWMGSPGLRAILHRAPKLLTIEAGENNYSETEIATSFLAAKQPLALGGFRANGLKPKDLDALIASPRLATLGALTLYNCAFDDTRAAKLVANPHAAAIGRLVLGGVPLTEAGRAALTARHGAHVVFVDE